MFLDLKVFQVALLLGLMLLIYPVVASAIRRWLEDQRFNARSFQREMALWKGWK